MVKLTKVVVNIIRMLAFLDGASGGAVVKCPYNVAMALIKKYPAQLGHVKVKLGAEGLLPSGAKLVRVGLATHGCDRGWRLHCYAYGNSDGIKPLKKLYQEKIKKASKMITTKGLSEVDDAKLDAINSLPHADFMAVAEASMEVPIIDDLVLALSLIALQIRHIGWETKHFTKEDHIKNLMDVFNKIEGAKNWLRDKHSTPGI